MKKTMILSLTLSLMIMSCRFDETIENIISAHAVTWEVPTDTEVTLFMADEDNKVVSHTVDGSQGNLFIDKQDQGVLYAYTGADKTVTVESDKAMLAYNGNEQRDGFLYAYDLLNGTDKSYLYFMQALSKVTVEVTNNTYLSLHIGQIAFHNIGVEGQLIIQGGDSEWEITQKGTTDTFGPKSEKLLQADSYTYESVWLIPQNQPTWDSKVLPGNEGAYITLQCYIVDESSGVPLYGDESMKEVAIPLPVNWSIGKEYTISLTLDHTTPWYDIQNDIPSKVLNPIIFDAEVDDWNTDI